MALNMETGYPRRITMTNTEQDISIGFWVHEDSGERYITPNTIKKYDVKITELQRQLQETQAKLEEATRAAAAYEAMTQDIKIAHLKWRAKQDEISAKDKQTGCLTISNAEESELKSQFYKLVAELLEQESATYHLDALLQAARQDEREKAISEDIKEAANRWNALFNCARITWMGHAGLGDDNKDPNGEDCGNYAHLTLNFWTIHEAPTSKETKDLLIKFTDKAMLSAAPKE